MGERDCTGDLLSPTLRAVRAVRPPSGGRCQILLAEQNNKKHVVEWRADTRVAVYRKDEGICN
jgi:hypothetical protein